MAVWNEVFFSELAGGKRLDAEYYDPQLLNYESAVKQFPCGWATLAEIAEIITDGDHLKRNYVDNGVLFLTSENFKEHSINYDSDLRIAADYEKTLSRARSEREAVFLTKTGKWYGKAAICLSDEPRFNISADVAKIRLRPEYDPFFLVCYLNSSVGYALVRRESTGASRDRIVLDNLRTLPIPLVPSSNMQFRQIVERINTSNHVAIATYTQAERLLLEELGLGDLDLSPMLFYERQFSETCAAGRLDAEYYMPPFYRALNAIRRTGDGCRLGDVLEFCDRGVQPEYDDEGKIGVINTKHMGPQFLSGEYEYCTADAWDRQMKARLKQYDVLFYSTGAYIGRTNCWFENKKAIGSNHVTIIRPKAECNPIFLSLFMNSEMGRMQADRHAHGSAQREVYPSDIRDFTLWLPPMKKQEQLASLILQAKSARDESRSLLEEAKSMVEKAILGE